MSIKQSVLVSIISPVYNREMLLDFTIQSIKNQTYPNWELLLIDDGSTDNSVDIAIEYAKEDNRIKLLKRNEEPKGAPTCRNIGLKNATGKYVIFLDSDDILAEFCLSERVFCFENDYPEKDFIVFPGLQFTEDLYDDNNLFISTYKGDDVIPLFLNKDIPWITLNPIYKRTSLNDKLLDWNKNILIFQDILFHISCVCRGLKFVYAGTKPDCFWRRHKQGNIGDLGISTPTHSSIISMCCLFNGFWNELKKSNKLTLHNKACLMNFVLNYMLKMPKFNTVQMQEVRFFVKNVDCMPRINKILLIVVSYFPIIYFARGIINKYIIHIWNSKEDTFEVKYFLKTKYINAK
jgi:glycosyltransferase involved in cell wall biosynthesis